MNGQIKLITGNKPSGRIAPTFNNVIGQEAALNKLGFFLETHDSDTPVPTFLFTGSHGLGKTYVAEKLATCMGRRFVEVNCGMLDTASALIEGVLLKRVIGETPCTIFFDESHRLSPEVTTVLLTLLNPSDDMTNVLHHKNWEIVFDMSKINVVFATTDAHRMFGPLVNRCERIYFDGYDGGELLDMLELYSPDISFSCNLDELANACRGRGRDAFQLAQKINRLAKRGNLRVLNNTAWTQLKQVFEIQELGLNRQEVELLRIVANHGTISVANIALAMMINSDNVESELEVRPRELGLLQSTSRGRSLTDKGSDYMKVLA
jgi:Holliday junction resolvasome RuvABC ATP-dependent DNA helicase subunit